MFHFLPLFQNAIEMVNIYEFILLSQIKSPLFELQKGNRSLRHFAAFPIAYYFL